MASYMRSINVFLSWLEKEGETGNLLAQLPSVPKRIRDTLSREEITRLEDAAELERDKLLVRVLADTGIRLAELLGLRASDLMTGDRRYALKVRGKGDRERLVSIKPRLGRRLKRHIDRVHQRTGEDYLWATHRRSAKTGAYVALERRTVQVTLKSLAEMSGVDPSRVHPAPSGTA